MTDSFFTPETRGFMCFLSLEQVSFDGLKKYCTSEVNIEKWRGDTISNIMKNFSFPESIRKKETDK